MSICPVPGCTGEAPARSIFCPDCYFRIPLKHAQTVNRVAFECERASDAETRSHLAQQLHGYVQAAIRAGALHG